MFVKKIALYVAIFGLYVCIAIVLLREYALSNGFLGHNWDWHYPTISTYYNFAAARELQTWDYDDLGFPRPYGYSLPWFVFSLSARFFNAELVQKVLLLSIPAVSAFGAFLLISYIITSRRIGTKSTVMLFAIIGGIVYGFGPAVFYMLLAGSLTVLLGVSLFPFALYWVIRYYQEGESFSILSKLYLFVTLLSISSISVTVLMYMMALLYLVLVSRLQRLRRFLMSLLPAVVFYLGYFLPVVFLRSYIQEIQAPPSIVNVPMPLLSFWQMDIYRRATYFNSVISNMKTLLIIGAFSLVIIALFPLFTSDKRMRCDANWAAVSYTIFLGLSTPALLLENTVRYLYEFPPFIFLRSIEYYAVAVTLSMSILVGLSLTLIISKRRFVRILCIMSVTISILFSESPWFTGDLGLSIRRNTYDSTLDVFVPSGDYFYAMGILANTTKVGYVLPIPMTLLPLYLPSEYWRQSHLVPAAGQQPDLFNSPWGVITADKLHIRYPYYFNSSNYEIRERLAQIVYSLRLANYSELISAMNVAYIIVFNNTLPSDQSMTEYPGYSKMINYLSHLSFLEPLVVGQSVALFEVVAPVYKPRIYTQSAFPTSVRYEIYSPTNYEVYVSTDGPFCVILSQSFDPLWKIYVNGRTDVALNHTLAYGYSNRWCLNVGPGTYDIRLVYMAQNYLVLGIMVWLVLTSVAFLLSILFTYSKLKLKHSWCRIGSKSYWDQI